MNKESNKTPQENKIDERNERYSEYVNTITPATGLWRSLFHAFLIGGITCCIGQGIYDIFAVILPNMSKDMIGNITSMTLISLAILFTGIGFYDIIAKVGGAGSFLPITGFANAISSASMEFKSEGLIFGTSVKMFNVVGPVIVNGIVWSTVAGLVNLLIGMVG